MTSMLFSFASLLLVLSPCGAAPSQETQDPAPKLRSRLIGRTVQPGGATWADCEINFFSRPMSEYLELGIADLVTVRSSSKGRFHAKLLPRRTYMAWAHSVDDKGRHWFGQAVERIVAGETVKFVRAKKPRAGETLLIKGQERWKALGPFSFHLRFGSQNREIPLEALDEKNCLSIPPFPYDKALILAKTAAGQPLFVFRFERSTFPFLPRAWKFAAPHPLQIHIKNDAGPVQGARVSAMTFHWGYRFNRNSRQKHSVFSLIRKTDQGLWAELGRSDAKGDCDLLAHNLNGSLRTLTLRIEAEGMADKFHVISIFPKPVAKIGEAASGAKKEAEPKRERIQVVMEKGVETHGRILWTEGKPIANLPFVVLRKAKSKKKKNYSPDIIVRSKVYRTGEDGSFSFSFLRAKTLFRIVTPLDEDLWTRLSSSYKGLRLPSPYLLLHQARSDQKARQDLGDLSLDKMVAVNLSLEGARRDRQANSIVMLKNTMEKASVISEAVSLLNYPFDAQGRACFLLPPASYDVLILHPERGSNQEPLALEDRDRGTIFERQIDLQPYHPILVSVTDGEGKPFAGAELSMGGGGYSHLSKLCSEIYEFNGRAIRQGVTDKDGIARIRLIAVKSQNYNCTARHATLRGNRSTSVRIDTNNLPETLDLELGR